MSEVKIVKFGEMKYDVPFETLGHHTEKYDFTVFEDWRIRREGQRLYNSRYDYLKECSCTVKKQATENNR